MTCFNIIISLINSPLLNRQVERIKVSTTTVSKRLGLSFRKCTKVSTELGKCSTRTHKDGALYKHAKTSSAET